VAGKFNDFIGNRSHDHPISNIVPQPTTLPRASHKISDLKFIRLTKLKVMILYNMSYYQQNALKVVSIHHII
jgi:hypothetical protein